MLAKHLQISHPKIHETIGAVWWYFFYPVFLSFDTKIMGTCLVRLFSKTCFKKLVFLEKKKDISSIFVKKYMFRKKKKKI